MGRIERIERWRVSLEGVPNEELACGWGFKKKELAQTKWTDQITNLPKGWMPKWGALTV